MAAEVTELHARFEYLQAETQRLASAYALAAEKLHELQEDNTILRDKLLRIRVRRRKLLHAADADMGALMTAKTIFFRRNRRAMRRKLPLASRHKISQALDEEWDALPKEAREKWQRELKTYAVKPTAPAPIPTAKPTVAKQPNKKEEKIEGTPVAPKKSTAKSRAKPKPPASSNPGTPVTAPDEPKPKPARKRPPPKKNDGTEPKKARKSPQVKTPRKPAASAAKKTPTKKGKKADTPAPPVRTADDLDDGSSGGSSAAASDEDDSDDNMMHLPMGAFG
ncbi:hypothetical protein ACHHYP_14090 [Achlya hypogyna]|uniref:HMG box domain-containing protein n=1 Tax=Achlya hypogyna TaxID=1202772 RepID=A0A1V9YE15_ACHHY|nr:hypothetical protein ACHHYP_14090 [Achlya hypogyna]